MLGNVIVHLLKSFIGLDLNKLNNVYSVTNVKNKIPKGNDELKKNFVSVKFTGKKVKTTPPIISNPNHIVAEEKNKTFVTFNIDTLYNE